MSIFRTLLAASLVVLACAPAIAAKPAASSTRPSASADRATLDFYLTTAPIGIENFELIYELAYRTGDYQKALDAVAEQKRKSAEIYADMPAAAQRLNLVPQLKQVRAAELALLESGAPGTTEPKYIWKTRLSALKARFAETSGALRVELETP